VQKKRSRRRKWMGLSVVSNFPHTWSNCAAAFAEKPTGNRGERESQLMKLHQLSLPLLALGGLVLSGCTTATTTRSQAQTDQTQKRVHTQDELRKTGQSETGPALEKVDPAISTGSGPR
jgi:hypothetical protein